MTPSGTENRYLRTPYATLRRREVLIALPAMTVALTVPSPSAAEVTDYPLWSIEMDHGRVYVLGHTPPRSQDWRDGRIEKLLRSCGAIWVETNHTVRMNGQDLMQRYGTDPAKPLDAFLSPLDRDRLSQAAKLTRVPEKSIARFRPWLAAQVLEDAFYSAPDFGGRNADQVLVSEAGEAGVPLFGEFATEEDAARWLSELPPAQELQYFRYILDEILIGHQEGQRIYQAWAAGDAAPAAAWVAGMKRRYPALYRTLLVERNLSWASRIRSMLAQQKDVMVDVGLYHLVGPDSIQAKLSANGARVAAH